MSSARFLQANCIVLLLVLAKPIAAVEILDYAALLQQLLASHPELTMMQREIEAAEAAVDGASALPDPMISIEWMDIDRRKPSLVPNQVGSVQYTWEQMFPLWGKRDLKTESALANVTSVKAKSVQTAAELRAMLRMAYADFHAAWRSHDINDEVLGLLRDMERNAQMRYGNGLAAQQDVIKARTEQTMLIAEQQMLRGEAERARAQINSLLGFAIDNPLPTTTELPSIKDIERSYLLWQQQLQQTPALQMAEAAVRKMTAENKLAQREWYPDLTVGITPVQVDDRLDSWQLMLGFSLPLFGSRRAMESESVAMLASAHARREVEYRRIVGNVAQILAEIRAIENQQQIFSQQLLPETELNFRSALAGYQTGKVDFDTLIEAERQIRQTRLLVLAAAVRQQRAAAQFEQATGMQP